MDYLGRRNTVMSTLTSLFALPLVMLLLPFIMFAQQYTIKQGGKISEDFYHALYKVNDHEFIDVSYGLFTRPQSDRILITKYDTSRYTGFYWVDEGIAGIRLYLCFFG
jgi:hypothetical protein